MTVVVIVHAQKWVSFSFLVTSSRPRQDPQDVPAFIPGYWMSAGRSASSETVAFTDPCGAQPYSWLSPDCVYY